MIMFNKSNSFFSFTKNTVGGYIIRGLNCFDVHLQPRNYRQAQFEDLRKKCIKVLHVDDKCPAEFFGGIGND